MDSVNQLIDQLKDSNASVRIDAAIALGQTGDARAIKPLIAAWRDSDENVRGTALSAVSKIGLPAVEALVDAMKHPEIGVRTKASCALDHIGELMGAAKDFRAIEPLIDAFSEESHRIRTHLASTLGKLGGLRAFQPLIKELKNPKGAHVRTAEALGKLGDAHLRIANHGFIAEDFYDGCIIYDFEKKEIQLCDFDHYHPGPFVNEVGRLFGSTRFMAPEEFRRGEQIDQTTNVFTLGRTAFVLLGDATDSKAAWKGTDAMWSVVKKATNADRTLRHQSVRDFVEDWRSAIVIQQ